MNQSEEGMSPGEGAPEAYETGDFVAHYCGSAFGIEHWVCPVTREIVPFSGFVIGPGPQMESATDRYAVQADVELPVMVSVEPGEDGSGTVVFRQEQRSEPLELAESELDIVLARPASYARLRLPPESNQVRTLLVTAVFSAIVAIILLIAGRRPSRRQIADGDFAERSGSG